MSFRSPVELFADVKTRGTLVGLVVKGLTLPELELDLPYAGGIGPRALMTLGNTV
jgi:hypothetical protein